MPNPAPRLLAAAVAAALGPSETVVTRAGAGVCVAVDPVEVRCVAADEAGSLRTLTPGWWAGAFGYEFGRPATVARSFPDVLLGRFDARLEITPHRVRVVGRGGAADRLRAALDAVDLREHTFRAPIDAWQSNIDFTGWCERIEQVKTWLASGECYQLNLTRTLRATGTVDATALFGHIAHRHPVPHAALVRLADHEVVSASPETFLRWRGPLVTTRPIKGTARSVDALVASAKDHIENVMIVDLARADFNQVCTPGTVEVRAVCEPEEHPGIAHLVSTVGGRRREHTDVADLIAATFPPASVTGVPKPRVLELIESIEAGPRGAYCGAIGWFDTVHDAGELSVAIRTFTVDQGGVSLGVGGGITAASDAAEEWHETELKTERLVALLDSSAAITA